MVASVEDSVFLHESWPPRDLERHLEVEERDRDQFVRSVMLDIKEL